jgi:hypothetical protein
MVFTHLVLLPARGLFALTLLYLAGVLLKGCVWGLAYRAQNPGDSRWVYRPLMSVFSAVALSWLLPYALVTIRRSIWSRGARVEVDDSLAPVLWVAPDGMEYPMAPLRWNAPKTTMHPVEPHAWALADGAVPVPAFSP